MSTATDRLRDIDVAGEDSPMASDAAGPDAPPPTAGGPRAARPDPGTADADASDRIGALRRRIDEIDSEIIALWRERASISSEVGRVRIASGGTRLVLSREREIITRFREALGADGAELARLILRAGRGPL